MGVKVTFEEPVRTRLRNIGTGEAMKPRFLLLIAVVVLLGVALGVAVVMDSGGAANDSGPKISSDAADDLQPKRDGLPGGPESPLGGNGPSGLKPHPNDVRANETTQPDPQNGSPNGEPEGGPADKPATPENTGPGPRNEALPSKTDEELMKEIHEALTATNFNITLAGVVVDSDGNPVSDADINLEYAWTTDPTEEETNAAKRNSMRAPSGRRSLGQSGKDGKFSYSFEHNTREKGEPMTLKIRAMHGSYDTAEWTDLIARNGETHDNLRLELPAAAGLAGVVRDAQGAPVPNATVNGYQEKQGDIPYRVKNGRTDAEGRYRMAGFHDGATVKVVVDAAGYKAQDTPTLVVSKGGDASVPDIVLAQVTALVFQLTCPDEKPRGNLDVVLFTEDGEQAAKYRVWIDENGRGIISVKQTGSYMLEIKHSVARTTERVRVTISADIHNELGTIALESIPQEERENNDSFPNRRG